MLLLQTIEDVVRGRTVKKARIAKSKSPPCLEKEMGKGKRPRKSSPPPPMLRPALETDESAQNPKKMKLLANSKPPKLSPVCGIDRKQKKCKGKSQKVTPVGQKVFFLDRYKIDIMRILHYCQR